ncbi:MAG: D-glycero-alpha-D-manno-heptose-1,7-bisphosphate 7-phosphatase [Janthinobacterium lividum]
MTQLGACPLATADTSDGRRQPTLAARRAAVFLDKDGTLINDVPYNVDPQRITLAAGAAHALGVLGNLGAPLFIISNQSGVAEGRFEMAALNAVAQRMRDLFAEHGARLAGCYFCPHHPRGRVPAYTRDCDCHKPGAGLLLRAAREHSLHLGASWMVGDILNDVEAGRRAGCRTALIDNGNETEWDVTPARTPDLIVADLGDAADYIFSNWPARSPVPARQPLGRLGPRRSISTAPRNSGGRP